MNIEIEIINGKLFVPLWGTIYVLTVEEAESLANQLQSAITAIRLTPVGADAASLRAVEAPGTSRGAAQLSR